MEIEGEANRMIQVCLERRGVSKKQKGVFRKHHGVSGVFLGSRRVCIGTC